MAGAPLVAALGLELDDAELGTALVRDHLGLDLDVRQSVAIDDIGAVNEQQRLQRDGLAVAGGQALDEQGFPLLYPVLLSTCLDDRVHG